MITRKMRLSMAMLTIAASVLTTGNIKAPQTVNMDAAGVIRSSYPCYIQYEYEQPFTCRNIEIVLNGNNYHSARVDLDQLRRQLGSFSFQPCLLSLTASLRHSC